MDIAKDTQEKITQLQLFEQNLHSFLTQKRNFQSQMLEIENALKEIETSKEKVYKIVGGVMLESTKEKLEKDLKERKEVLDLRMNSIDKQEKSVKERAEKIQKEVMAEIEGQMKGAEDGKSD